MSRRWPEEEGRDETLFWHCVGCGGYAWHRGAAGPAPEGPRWHGVRSRGPAGRAPEGPRRHVRLRILLRLDAPRLAPPSLAPASLGRTAAGPRALGPPRRRGG